MGRDKSRKFFKQKFALQKKQTVTKKQKQKQQQNIGDGLENNDSTDHVNGKNNNDHNDSSPHLHVPTTTSYNQNNQDFQFEDNISLVSELTIDVDQVRNDIEENEIFNELNDHFDELNEKDSETRILALDKINHALRQRIFDEYFRQNSCDKLHGLIYMLTQSIRRGDVSEQLKALETVALTALSLQANVDYFLKQFRSVIIPLIDKPHSRLVQIKAIEVWTCLAWIYEDKSTNKTTLRLYENIWHKKLSKTALRLKMTENKQQFQKTYDEIKAIKKQQKTPQTSNENSENEILLEEQEQEQEEEENGMDIIEDLPPIQDMLDENEDDNQNKPVIEKSFFTSEQKFTSSLLNTDTNDNNLVNLDTVDDDKKQEDIDYKSNLELPHQQESANNSNQVLHTPIYNAITRTTPDAVVVAAVENWSWIISSIGNEDAIGSLFEVYKDDLFDLLNNNHSINLRNAVGEALTLLIVNYQQYREHNLHDYDFNDIDYNDIVEKFEELLKENDKQRKNVLRDQRRRYRDYVHSINDNWGPRINIKLRGSKFSLNGWNKWIQYHCVKNILQNGLQTHLLKNVMLQRTFDISDIVTKQTRLTKNEKKAKTLSLHEANLQMNQEREDNRTHKQAFMFEHE